MSTRDSGVIDLFAIHERHSAPAPSAAPPAVSLDISDDDVEGFAAARQTAQRRAKIIGGVIGGFAVVGIVIAAITLGSSPAPAKASAAAAPPPPAAVTVPPVAEPAPAPPPADPVPPPPSTAKSYTPATAAAAYAAQQAAAPGAKKRAPKAGGARSVGGGVKLQKVQSSGVSN